MTTTNDSPRGLGEQGRGEGQDNNDAQKHSIFTPSYPPRFATEDIRWFKDNPDRRYRLRPCRKSEFPHISKPAYVFPPPNYALIHWDAFFGTLDQWLLESGCADVRSCEAMALVMEPREYDKMLGNLWDALSGSRKIRWAADTSYLDWLSAYRRERGLL